MYAETKHEWGMDNTLSAEVMRPLEERRGKARPQRLPRQAPRAPAERSL